MADISPEDSDPYPICTVSDVMTPDRESVNWHSLEISLTKTGSLITFEILALTSSEC